ncbi:hypothetical protein WR25_16274 [Diploscapter pachys]|uniref:Sulfotransferase domain-containing protein n=1 Tax=Diploscapter pachys TaxID=2018661 RepID=A0A2A2L883_9BILA|nr:hypothetical protein WR25_16274 [Diploscapter pachys]
MEDGWKDFGKDYNLGLCLIEKCASTLSVGINCFVKKGEFFERLGIKISDGWSKTSWCLDDYSTFNLSNPNIDVVELGFKEKRMIAIVREPLDRFISAFINKCIDEEDWTESFVHCYDCHKNMSCVVERAYNRMVEISKAKHFELDYTDRHFTPLSWYCNFKKHFRKYTLIKKESSSDAGKTHHSTSHTIRRQKYEKEMFTNPYVMQTLKKMYYYDYLIFNFDTAVFDNVKLPEDY